MAAEITPGLLDRIAAHAYAYGVGPANDDWERGFAAGMEALADRLAGKTDHSYRQLLAEILPASLR